MGQDKSRIVIDGLTLAARTAHLLSLVVETAIEIGPGVSGLSAILEQPRGEGPLVAIAASCGVLRDQGHTGAALVIACDLPFISERLLRFLAEYPAEGSVVPSVRGRPQPLCARWGAQDLNGAQELVNRGVRSLQHLSNQPDVAYLDESVWEHVANERDFSDVDSPDDLYRLGLTTRITPN
jgi:molybdopterin-guanine dinucleotide biosynthesis protein A